MLTEQIIKFESRGPGPLVGHILRQLVVFMTKQKSKEYLRVDYFIIYC